MAKQVKITVLKRELYKDLIEEYASNKATEQCKFYEDNQVFILDKPNMPEGFCSWAWSDIHKDVISVYHGASFPWMEKKNSIVTGCTDGLRPVIFKVELTEG